MHKTCVKYSILGICDIWRSLHSLEKIEKIKRELHTFKWSIFDDFWTRNIRNTFRKVSE